ncbi:MULTISPECIES: trehalose operon repressor [Lactobacillus]|uniref:trehalose operon repressor n=1 Tax=Lactobacillus TaxID=1578 RepID=UPI000CD9DBC5|nr:MULTISPECIES: trehalose operon repressor [Lactobacillus]RVU72336.1 trehalose operon repressor [Lactobacillus xujianguonis]
MVRTKADIIAQDLVAKIKHGQPGVGEFLPSENELTRIYGSSRETVRKALDQLTSLGLIQKIKGKGSVVLDLERYSFPISGITSFAELNQSLGMKAETKVVKLEKLPDLPALFKEKFPEQEKQDGFYVERLRLIDGEPEVLDCDYLFNPPVTDLPEAAAAKSIYEYLEQDLGLNISYATKEITVEKINQDLQEQLQLPDSTAVLVTSHNFLNDTTLFQLTLSFHDPAKFKFVDFARRQRIKI